jgi:DNA-directed RNA polymerase specialized sigma24 family protein
MTAQRDLPQLSAEPLARFTSLITRSSSRGHKARYCTLRPDLVDYWDERRAHALACWAGLSDEERAVYLAIRVHHETQVACGARLGLSQATVSRRLRSAQNALQALR